jgi:hypothetical protein
MGVFNSVYTECRRCGDNVEFQSKAVDGCASYTLDNVPLPIAAEMIDRSLHCKCGAVAIVRGRIVLWLEREA